MNPQNPSFQLPIAMSSGAASIDWLYNALFWFSVLFLVAITGAVLYFVWRYRRRPGVTSEPTKDHLSLELAWTIAPSLFIVVLFHVSFDAYIRNATPTEGATEFRVRGKKWAWEFEYPGGTREPGEITLPVGKPVKFVLSSDDVLHSFYVPAFRLKKDAVPGMYSQIAFTPTVEGDAQVFCAEYCGTNHSGMLAQIHIVSEQKYKAHLESLEKGVPAGLTPEKWGEELFVKNGCSACHSRDGSKLIGPTMKGVFGRHEALTTGAVDIDENYIRESILQPQAKIVAGFTTVQMPPFVLKDPQIDAIIAYLKTLK